MTSTFSFLTKLTPSFQRWVAFGLLVGGLIFLTGCAASGDLIYQPYNRPLASSDFFADGRSARPWVPGTVAQIERRVDDPIMTGKDENGEILAKLPIPITNDLVKRGQERYNIYCVVCHDMDGHGKGKVVNYKFPAPPDLLGSAAVALTDGAMFNIITNGQGNMLSYGYRVKVPDRWAIIAYLRAMQLNNGHLTQDLTPTQLQQLGNR